MSMLIIILDCIREHLNLIIWNFFIVSRFAELISQHKAISKKIVRQCQTTNFEEFVYLLSVNILNILKSSCLSQLWSYRSNAFYR